MTTINRQRNTRVIRIFPTQANRDDDVGDALPGDTDTLYSNPISGPCCEGIISLMLEWTGGNTGTFTLQYTLKPYPELSDDTDWITMTPTVVGSALAITGETAAFLDLATKTTNCDTVIQAEAGLGVDGDDVTIAFADGDSNDDGTFDESAYPDITFSFKNGVTTVSDFEAAVAASTHLRVKTAGTGANVLASTVDEFGAAHLAGAVAGTAGKNMIEGPIGLPEWFRVKYVNTSGLGSVVKGYARVSE